MARSFSGDKKQLLSLLKAALAHRGTVMLDVISPCVTFNDHEGSTKSYAYVKEHDDPLEEVSFVPFFEDITVDYEPGTTQEVTMHDGSKLYLKKLEEGYDPTDKIARADAAARDRAPRRVRDRHHLHRARSRRFPRRSSTSWTSRWRPCRSTAFGPVPRRSRKSWKSLR